jgi:protein-disulfide isomerase
MLNESPADEGKNDISVLTSAQISTIKKDAFVDGYNDARILIIEYTDPECPYCTRQIKNETIKNVMGLGSGTIAHIAKVVQ